LQVFDFESGGDGHARFSGVDPRIIPAAPEASVAQRVMTCDVRKRMARAPGHFIRAQKKARPEPRLKVRPDRAPMSRRLIGVSHHFWQ
jgi:hypothetical protein